MQQKQLQNRVATRLTAQRRRLVNTRARTGAGSFKSMASRLDQAGAQLAAARHGRGQR